MTETSDERRDALITKARDLEANRGDLQTWLDADPSVAWLDDSGDSYHSKLRALYLEAGWETCYHRDAKFHYNVKLNGNAAYREFHRLLSDLETTRGDSFGLDTFLAIAESIQTDELSNWWEDLADTRYPVWTETETSHAGRHIYACGRSGGYVNADDFTSDPVAMIELGTYCQTARDYYNGADWAQYQFEMTLERYDAERLADLASPRRESLVW